MTNFRVGQKVVCINDTNAPSLEQGRVYTVTAVLDVLLGTRLGTWEAGLVVAETSTVDGSIGFAVSRFRPVAERKTDISLFRAMLTPSKQKVEA